MTRASHRIGMLTPSSNTVLEPYSYALLGELSPRISCHFSRFRVTRIAVDADSDRQFETPALLAAAELLADARVDALLWNGTAAAWLGFDRDRALCAALTARTGVPASTTVLALNALLRAQGVQRLGLVTPYTAAVENRIVARYADIGITVSAARRLDLSDNHAFGTVDDDTVAALIRAVAAERPQAIAVLCTNLRGARAAAALEDELGIPLYDSVAVTLWAALGLLGVDPAPLRGHGSLFAAPFPTIAEPEHTHG